MATRSSHNKNNSAVKRILQEARELQNDASPEYSGAPLEEDIFEWHCTIRGPADTEFADGLYHCRILLPAEYPFRPPSVMLLTPNGRFELHKKICISFTSYHEEHWQPAWGVRTAIVGLQGFFPMKGEAALGIGSLEYPAAERKRLAALSREWVCPDCGVPNKELLPDVKPSAAVSAEESDSNSITAASANLTSTATSMTPEHVPTPVSPPASTSQFIFSPAPESAAAAGPTVPIVPPSNPFPHTHTHPPAAPVPMPIVYDQPLPTRPPIVLDGLILMLLTAVVGMLAKKFY